MLGSTSTKTGRGPGRRRELALAANVIVPDEHFVAGTDAHGVHRGVQGGRAGAHRHRLRRARRGCQPFSNSSTFGPVVADRGPALPTTAATSASSIDCRPYGSSFERTGVPPSMASCCVAKEIWSAA